MSLVYDLLKLPLNINYPIYYRPIKHIFRVFSNTENAFKSRVKLYLQSAIVYQLCINPPKYNRAHIMKEILICALLLLPSFICSIDTQVFFK